MRLLLLLQFLIFEKVLNGTESEKNIFSYSADYTTGNLSKTDENLSIDEFKKLNLISEINFRTINNRTRDSKIKVIQDTKSKIIFLEKFITNNEYYSSFKYTDGRKMVKNSVSNISEIKTSSGKITTSLIDDNVRRSKQFKQILKNRDILDFGCGRGEFLKNIKSYKSLNGIEIRKDCLDYVNSKIKRINISIKVYRFIS